MPSHDPGTDGSTEGDASHPATWLRVAARLGYASIGVVYLVVAAMAARAVIAWQPTNPNAKHAMETLEIAPFGGVALFAIGVGMFGYGLWRIVVAFTDPEERGLGFGGLLQRTGFVLSGIMHGFIGAEAFHFAAGAMGAAHPSRSTQDSADSWTAAVLRMPFGRWLVGAVGVGIAVFALYELYRSVRWDLRALLRTTELPPSMITATIWLARPGMAIRAVVIGVIGIYLTAAAVTYQPSRAVGVAEAFGEIGAWRYGRYAVAATAFGFAVFGVYQILMSRTRRVDVT